VQDDAGDDAEPIDTGADDGQGGVEVVEDPKNDDIPLGEPDEVNLGVLQWMEHDEKPKSIQEQEADDAKAVDIAIIQGLYFETPSKNITGVREWRYGEDELDAHGDSMALAWNHKTYIKWGYDRKELGIEGDFDTPESILGPALLRARVAFSENQRGKDLRHLKGGKVDPNVLGRRAFHGDDRLFKRRVTPGKRNYFVCIGVDVSGSTIGRNIVLEKMAVMAQARLLARMGIKFAIYAHTGNYTDPSEGRRAGLSLDMYLVKEPDEPWTPKIEERLRELGPASVNLDGHTLEYYRKVLDKVQATDKIILYYTDGKMPAENHDEELEILQREIKTCKRKGYTLLGVGIRTDSPIKHGLDTVQVDDVGDIVKVVKHLEKRLLQR
jgi:cobalamin biosynthesis protein CobT